MVEAAAPEAAMPEPGCALCPRLARFRAANRRAHPDFFNSPVPSFGAASPRLLIVGLAPGLKGANRTSRPFTGDYAGDLLYRTLTNFGFAQGTYDRRADDGLRLIGCRITNAVRCVPPENKPTTAEIKTCLRFLKAELAAARGLEMVLALGTVAHGAVLSALDQKKSAFPFRHGAVHELPGGLLLADSYHCSRYNTNTGRLTVGMFEAVFSEVRWQLG
jgi:uracil-DNA glycosylase family 4